MPDLTPTGPEGRDALTVIAEALLHQDEVPWSDRAADILAALSPDGEPVLLVDGRVVAVSVIAWRDPNDCIYRTPAPWRQAVYTPRENSDA